MQDKIVDLLQSTGREGMEELITFLSEKSDFFTAPASTKFHGAYPGGLAEHSMNVCDCALSLNEKYDTLYPVNVVTIAALLHDICKINTYKENNESPSTAQVKYLISLCSKVGLKPPKELNKAYASVLIDFLLNSYKDDGVLPPFVHNYQVKDTLPLGHGEKSLYIVTRFIKLSNEEALAIRWHMGAWDLGDSPYQKFAYKDAVNSCKLVSILELADTEATHLIEE